MKKNINKRLDYFYAQEDHFSKPKEYFKEALQIIQPTLLDKQGSLLDIGCAAGDFIQYCANNFPIWHYSGVDVFDENIIEARRRYPEGEFFNFDMSSQDEPITKKFDVVTMLGTLSIFSDTSWINNYSKFLKNGGVGLIFGMVNPYPYDVFVSLKKFGNKQYEYGWNSWCYETLRDEFLKHNCFTSIQYWTLPIDISLRREDPLRSWTVKLEDGANLVTNGSRMIHDFAFITIEKRQVA
jgi:cyclopropane fatty-acyl-phospholipid synthase-like methyltransferase